MTFFSQVNLNYSPGQIALIGGFLIFLSIMASKISERTSVPVLLLFLIIGMLAGSDGPGGIYFDNAVLANLFATFSLSYILFSGGLDTKWRMVRPVLPQGIILSTFGVAVTAGLVGIFIWKVLNIPVKEGLLLGAIVSSTDAAAVFAIMRSRGVSLKGNLTPLLELESGSNDPMAIFLTLAVMNMLMAANSSIIKFVPFFIINMSFGIAIGLIMGKVSKEIFNRLHLEYEGLYPVLSMSIVLMTYGLSVLVKGNGFLAVYICGLILGNTKFLHKRSLSKFHDGLGWLMQICMFLVLGLLVFPTRLPNVAVSALLVSLFLMFVARPVAVYISLWKSNFSFREKTLVAWTGLRGAVPIVLATFPFTAGYSHADRIFHTIFFIVIASVLFQGKTLMILARWLKVDKPLLPHPPYPLEFEETERMQGETSEIEILPDSAAANKLISELGLPASVLILLIRRGDSFLVPRGQTRIEPYDTLLVITKPKEFHSVYKKLVTE